MSWEGSSRALRTARRGSGGPSDATATLLPYTLTLTLTLPLTPTTDPTPTFNPITRRALRRFYPGLADGDDVSVVHFDLSDEKLS